MAEKKYLDLDGLKHFFDKLNQKKANLESPVFTGVPTAPTAELNDNSTKIATTAFVKNEINELDLGLEWGDLDSEEEGE